MIRKLDKDDINKVTQIWLEGNIKAHPFIHEQYWIERFKDVKESLLSAEVYVYEKDREILGFIGLVDRYIAGIFVSLPSKGIGKLLLDYVKGIKKELSLCVYEKNEPAIRFYRREKFIAQADNIDESTGERESLMIWKR